MLGAKKKADGTAVGAPAQASDRSWGLGRAKRRPSEITAGAASSAVAASAEPPKPTELGMPPKPVAAAASAGKSDLTGSQSMSMRQPGGRRASRSMEDVEAIMALQESIAAEKKERVSMPDSFDDGGDGEKKNSRASHADPKVAAAKAATARFKLNTPPRAAVEVTGIYTDRTYGAKVGWPSYSTTTTHQHRAGAPFLHHLASRSLESACPMPYLHSSCLNMHASIC